MYAAVETAGSYAVMGLVHVFGARAEVVQKMWEPFTIGSLA